MKKTAGILKNGPLADMIGFRLRIAQSAAERAFMAAVQGTAPTGHFTILTLVRENPGSRQSAIARAAHLDRSSLVPVLDQLENLGLVERRKHKTDRRAHALYLTDAGQAALKKLERAVMKLEKQVREALGGNRTESLLRDLEDFSALF